VSEAPHLPKVNCAVAALGYIDISLASNQILAALDPKGRRRIAQGVSPWYDSHLISKSPEGATPRYVNIASPFQGFEISDRHADPGLTPWAILRRAVGAEEKTAKIYFGQQCGSSQPGPTDRLLSST